MAGFSFGQTYQYSLCSLLLFMSATRSFFQEPEKLASSPK